MVEDENITCFFEQVVQAQHHRPFQCLVDDLFERKSCYLFGAAQMGRKFVEVFSKLGIEVVGIADNNSVLWGRLIAGVQVVNPQSIPQDAIVVLTSKYVKDLYRQMKGYSYSNLLPHYALTVYLPHLFPNMAHMWCKDIFLDEKDDIKKAYSLLGDETSKKIFLSLLNFRQTLNPLELPNVMNEQYFPTDIWRFSENESYIDIGAYDGDTLQSFVTAIGEKTFKEYYAFEPDMKAYSRLKERARGFGKNNLHFYPLGVGEKNEVVKFSATGTLDSHISTNGTEEVNVISLDSFFIEKQITTIKMDVEGYEAKVIHGAQKIISQQKPKLAVCVYHQPTDLWRLLLQIYELNSQYNFFLRHHDHEIYETVLYCFNERQIVK